MKFKLNSRITAHMTMTVIVFLVTTLLTVPNITHAQTSPSPSTITAGTFFDGEFIVQYDEGSSPDDIDTQIALRKERAKTTLGRLQNQQDNIVLSLKGEMTPEEIQIKMDSLKNRFSATSIQKADYLEETYVYELENIQSSDDIETVLHAYKELPITYVQPNYKYYLFATPTDPEYSKQWGFPLIQTENGWDTSTGSKNVTVAVVDSGIDVNHPDVSANVAKSVPIAQGCIHNGDSNGHGTHVAGVIGATANNARGIAGMNWNVTINGYCVVSPTGIGSSITIAQGINQAVADNADVINLSLGGPLFPGLDRVLAEAVQDAYDDGVTLVAAAGNCGNLPPGQYPQSPECYWGGDANRYTPGAYTTTINVAAIGPKSEHPRYSNIGSALDISAPGGNPPSGSGSCAASGSDCVYSTWDRFKPCPASGSSQQYCPMAGTSMAAPHITGLAALILSVDNTLTPDQVRDIIVSSADDLGSPGKDNTFGHGRAHVHAALVQADGGTITAPPPTLTPVPTGSVDCEVQKRKGDYNCSLDINLADFEAWRQDFVQEKSSLQEFEWFRAGFILRSAS